MAMLCCVMLLLAAATPAAGKIYQWRDKDGVLHMSSKPPKDLKKAYKPAPKKPQPESAVEDPEALQTSEDALPPGFEKAPQTAADADPPPAPFFAASDDAIINKVSSALLQKKARDVSELINLTANELDRSAAEKMRGMREVYLQTAFNQFGGPKKLTPAAPGESIYLPGVSMGAAKPEKGGRCYDRNFNAEARKGGAMAVRLTMCQKDGQHWMHDIQLGFQQPTPENKDKSKVFQKQFGKDLTKAMADIKARAKQVAAAPPKLTPKPKPKTTPQATPKPKPTARPMPTAAPAPQTPQSPMGQLPPMPTAPGLPPEAMEYLPMMMSMFSGGFFFTMAAISLFFYMFFGLSLYVIARKQQLENAWLAWVPVAQYHTMVQAAGKSWMWTACFILPMLGFIPILGLIFSLLGLVSIVLIGMVWVAICDRMGFNKWLGLLIYVPVANLILMGVVAFRSRYQAPGFNVMRTSAIAGIVFIVLSVLMWLMISMTIAPMLDQFRGFFSGGVMDMTQATQPAPQGQPGNIPSAKPTQPKKTDGPAVKAPKSAKSKVPTPADFKKFLASGAPKWDDWDKGPKASNGPVALMLDNFWEASTEKETPHVWIKVRIPAVPLLDSYRGATLRVKSIKSSSGKELYDKDHNFETEFFQKLNFNSMQGQPYFDAIRDVRLKSGTKESDIASVQGLVTLHVPTGVQVTRLTKKDVGESYKLGAMTVIMKKLDGSKVSLELRGPPKNHIATKAYGANGAALESAGKSWSDSDNYKNEQSDWSAPVQEVEVIVADDMVAHKYPFTIKK